MSSRTHARKDASSEAIQAPAAGAGARAGRCSWTGVAGASVSKVSEVVIVLACGHRRAARPDSGREPRGLPSLRREKQGMPRRAASARKISCGASEDATRKKPLTACWREGQRGDVDRGSICRHPPPKDKAPVDTSPEIDRSCCVLCASRGGIETRPDCRPQARRPRPVQPCAAMTSGGACTSSISTPSPAIGNSSLLLGCRKVMS